MNLDAAVPKSLLVLFICIVSLVLGQVVGSGGLDFQLVVFVAIGLSALLIITSRHYGLQIGAIVWIGMFSLGYRTVPVTSVFRIHPLLLMAVLVSVIAVSQKREFLTSLIKSGGISTPLLVVSAIFWLNGWLQGLIRARAWDSMATEALNVLLLFFVFLIMSAALSDKSYWKTAIGVFYGVGTVIAALGTLEYFVPELGIHLISGFIVGEQTFIAGADGFVRATFAFWGAPNAGFVCLLALPLTISLLSWVQRPDAQLLVIVSGILQIVGIYICGYRSIWFLAGIVLVITVIGRRNIIFSILSVGIVVVVLSIIPDTAQERAVRAFEVLQGIQSDNSMQVRYDRAFRAIEDGLSAPLGVGWGGTGWTHSDFAQIAGNLGLPAGLLFLGGYLLTLFRAWQTLQRSHDRLMLGLLGSFVGVGGLLFSQGIQVLTQLVAPAWFVWALTLIRINQLKANNGKS